MRLLRNRRCLFALSPAALLVLSAGASAQTFWPIALSGRTDALGPNLGAATFTNLGGASPAINASGQIVFRGDTTLASNGNSQGNIFTYDGASNLLRATISTAAPDGTTYTASGFNALSINASGRIAFRDSTTALYADSGSGITQGLRTTLVAPGAGGATFTSIQNPSPLFNDTGLLGARAQLTTGSGSPAVVATGVTANSTGIWTGSVGGGSPTFNNAVRQNASLPPSFVDVRLGVMDATGLNMNGSGALLFTAALQGTVVTGATAGNDQVVASTRTGSLEVIARRGSPAIGASDGANYRALSNTAMNNAGRIAFSSTLRDGTVGTNTNHGALFSDTTGTFAMHARLGGGLPASTGLAGLNWGGFFSNVVITRAGNVYFRNAGITDADTLTGPTVGTNDTTGIFKLDASGAITTAFRQGSVVPAISTVVGDTVIASGLQSGFSVNNNGAFAFSSTISGTGVNGTIGNNNALFAVDPSGMMMLIAQRQTAFTVAPGDVRIVSAIGGISQSGMEDGQALSINDRNWLTFSLSFADGTSGVFVAAIPGPSAGAMLGIAGLALARRRRV